MSEAEETEVLTDDTDTDTDFVTRGDALGAERVVVKAGTNSLTDDDSRLDRVKLDKLVDDVMDLIERDKQVIVVSSGAIGAGKGSVTIPNDSVENLQAASTVGQSYLMRNYSESFERYGVDVAQILVTLHDLEDENRLENFRNTVETLLDWGIVPIVNENDAVAVEEIKVGDNDLISASIAIDVDADLLVTLTDVGGVYTDNPKDDPDACLIRRVEGEFDALWEHIGEDTNGFGGITTKVEGAQRVNDGGVPAVIAASGERGVLEKVAEGDEVGTFFAPLKEDDNDD